MKRIGMAIGIVTLVFMGFLPFFAVVSADTTTVFTTTADVDAGTKSNPGDGNYGIETNTDNLGIATGVFEFASLKGDSFTLADADANTFKWTSGNVRSPVSPQKEILSGILRQSVTDSGPEVLPAVETSSDATFSGDFDLRLKIDENTCTILGNCVTRITISNEKLSNMEYSDSATVDGVLYQNGAGTLSFFTITDGGVTAVGTGTAVPSDPIWFRVTRATNTWTAYYSTDGTAYTQDEQGTNTVAGGLYLQIYTQVSGIAVTHIVDYDDFRFVTGTVGSGGFRTTGNWVSAAQTEATEEFSSVAVTFSGVSATNYITAMALINGADAVVYTDLTDITSGTTHTYTLPDPITIVGAWKVRLNLTGAGGGTPAIADITVFTVPPPFCFAESAFGSIIFLILPVLIGASILLILFAVFMAKRGGGVFEGGVGPVIALVVSVIVAIVIVTSLFGVLSTGTAC